MALSAGEFVLPGFGGDPGQALGNVANKLYMRNYQQQRLSLQAEGKRQQSGQFLERFLDPKQYLSGTAYDPMIVSSINEALQKGAEMAEQGADIPTMLMGLGSYTSKINDYSNKAKLISKQIDNSIEELRKTGVKGFDYRGIKTGAQRLAFHNIDEKTGNDLGLQQDISAVDPNRDYVSEMIDKHPDKITNPTDLDAFAKEAPQVDTSIDKYTANSKNFRREHSKIGFKGQNYLVPEYNDKGEYTESVPKYEHATDGGAPIEHTFTDANGKETNAPVRLLDNQVFNDMVKRKGVGDYIRGQVMKHLREYQSPDGKPIGLDSPQANLVARAIAYDELKSRVSGGVKQVEDQGRPTIFEMFGGKEQQAYDSRMGKGNAEYDLGVEGKLPKKGKDPKISTVDALHEVGNNNPDYLDENPEEHNGKAVIDVLSQLPKGQLKYGPAKFQAYKHAYYNPEDHSFTLVKNDKKTPEETIEEKDFPRFLHSVAALNGGATADVTKSLNKYGYSNGKFSKSGDAPDLAPALQEHRETLVNNAMSADTEEKKSQALKDANLKIPDGTVTGMYKGFWGSYWLKYIKPNGKPDEKSFPSTEAMEHYLKQSTMAKESKTTSEAKPAASNLTKEEQAALDKYGGK